ncbi:MAG: putative glycolipid-binding domain-containing protein [Ignavibacteriaceae bacterium]
MKQKSIYVWERMDEKTIEYCTVNYNDDIQINSYITGVVEDNPFHVEYGLRLNKKWQINSFSIKIFSRSEKTMSLTGQEDLNSAFVWKDEKGKPLPEFNGCNDIDISLTPLTNTLPIRRLSLPPNQPQIINVLYINLPSGDLKPVKQRYTNLGNNKYLYESLDSDFKSEIDINNEGFVTKYSIYWKLIKS